VTPRRPGIVLDRVAERVIEWSAKLKTRVELVDGKLRSSSPTDSGRS
jgi:hypothetical protein